MIFEIYVKKIALPHPQFIKKREERTNRALRTYETPLDLVLTKAQSSSEDRDRKYQLSVLCECPSLIRSTLPGVCFVIVNIS